MSSSRAGIEPRTAWLIRLERDELGPLVLGEVPPRNLAKRRTEIGDVVRPGGRPEQRDGAVLACRDEPLAIRRELHGVHPVPLSRNRLADPLARLHVYELDLARGRAGGQDPPVRTEAERQ